MDLKSPVRVSQFRCVQTVVPRHCHVTELLLGYHNATHILLPSIRFQIVLLGYNGSVVLNVCSLTTMISVVLVPQ